MLYEGTLYFSFFLSNLQTLHGLFQNNSQGNHNRDPAEPWKDVRWLLFPGGQESDSQKPIREDTIGW